MDERFEEILILIAGGQALRHSLAETGLSRGVFSRRIAVDEEYRGRYLDAKRAGVLLEVEKIADVFEDLRADLLSKELDGDTKKAMVMAARSEVDALKWKLSKLVPRTFGDAPPSLPQTRQAVLEIDLKPDEQ